MNSTCMNSNNDKMNGLSLLLLLLLLLHVLLLSEARQFGDLTLDQIEQQLASLGNGRGSNDDEATLLRVTDAQRTFGLPPVSWRGVTCSPLIARATDHATLARDAERPQVLLSGALHGDERVGPVVVTETIRLLMEAAQCDGSQLVHESGLKHTCNSLDVRTRDWLWHLLHSRDIFAVPAANCAGYALRERTERQIDPNRDFPFEESPHKCMKTTTARVFNELWRSNLFQVAVTFHGGMEAISWVWGSPSHPAAHDISPDDVASSQFGRALRHAAGKTAWGTPYQIGRMSSLVYPVSGGMEDWAYGTGWAHRQQPCQTDQYPPERTVYETEDPSFRTAIFLVEASNQKSPPQHRYGHFDELFASTTGVGHASRDIRLSLMALELAQPYVCFDAVSLTRASELRENTISHLHVAWYVGGVLSVEETFLTLEPAPKENEQRFSTNSNFTMTELRTAVSVTNVRRPRRLRNTVPPRPGSVLVSRKFSGGYGWKNPSLGWNESSRVGGFPPAPLPSQSQQSLFTTDFDVLPRATKPGVYWVIAWTRADQSWQQQAGSAQPNKPPQTHLANARTNPRWAADKGDRIVKGRLYWPSAPLVIRVTESREVEVLSWTLRCRHSISTPGNSV